MIVDTQEKLIYGTEIANCDSTWRPNKITAKFKGKTSDILQSTVFG
jgi:hypothetical protein